MPTPNPRGGCGWVATVTGSSYGWVSLLQSMAQGVSRSGIVHDYVTPSCPSYGQVIAHMLKLAYQLAPCARLVRVVLSLKGRIICGPQSYLLVTRMVAQFVRV